MKSNFKYRVSVGIAVVVLMCGGASVDAFAQNAGGCFSGPAKMADADVSAFLANPSSLLNSSPLGGLPMTSQVRALAGSSSASLDVLIGLAAQANASQKISLGTGLAHAAKSCQAASLDYAQLIQEKMAAPGLDKDLVAAFKAGLADIPTAALGGAAGAGGGGAAGIAGGGSAGGASGSGAADQSTSTPSATDSFSVGSRGSFTRNSTTTTTTADTSPI